MLPSLVGVFRCDEHGDQKRFGEERIYFRLGQKLKRGQELGDRN